MLRLLVLAALVVFVYKMIVGRWPWEKRLSTKAQALFRARQLLSVSEHAPREEILAAHKRVVAMVHPDRGGTNAQVHEANSARDLLLAELPLPGETDN